MSLEDEAQRELDELRERSLLRTPRVVDGRQGPTVVVDGREVVSFSSNDYLGLAGDPRLARAAAAASEVEGAGVGSSRLVVGNHREHVALEAAVADWVRCGAATMFNTGYAANVGVLGALLRAGDVVFSDALNHASIVDGCRLSRAEVVVFPHRDLAALERELVQRTDRRRRIVVSESLFSMDGDCADVAALAELCRRHDAAWILDEAHAVGVRGPEGRGFAAEAGVVPDVLIGTFGKALGSFGAFVATTPAIAALLWNRARPLVFSTGLPPAVAAASRAAIEVVRGGEGDERRRMLAARATRLRELVPDLGGIAEGPIAPRLVGSDAAVMKLSARLFEERLYVQGIRPPTVPVGTARLRISLSSAHTVEMVEQLARSLVRS
ncbi:MAG: 8-amino-7-oxononanoate synthase [Deltaproteobacteria bacterium]|nr:8-amino-7-oxononanoate synthase [Deltaproteobacteria bacterium]